MTFKFEAKYGLLTYAQCGNLDAFRIVEHLSELGAECIIGREIHEDGGTHLHAFFMFERKYATRNIRAFDVDGYHPNIVRGYGTPEKGWDYATKDGDVVAGGLERPSGTGDNSSENKWAEIIMAESREEFFSRVARLDPRALACNFGNLEKYADWKYRPVVEEYKHPECLSISPNKPEELDEWAYANVGNISDGMCAPLPGVLTDPRGAFRDRPFGLNPLAAVAGSRANNYRQTKVFGIIWTFQNGQNSMGKEHWKTCILWGAFFLGRANRECRICCF